MDYEKKYKEVLELARQLKDEYNDIEGNYPNQWICEKLFPELKESEDEKIRKAIVDTIKFYGAAMGSPYLSGIDKKDVLTWLEKQGEQKPAWSEEDENIKESIITGLEMLKDGVSDKSLIALYNKKIDWLKSLKPQKQWKPSEEQIKSVKEAACYSSVFSEKTIDNLILLSKQLKKLREE